MSECMINPEGAAAALFVFAVLAGFGVARVLLAWARKIEAAIE